MDILKGIRGPRLVHGVRSETEYARKHAAQLAELRRTGREVYEWSADDGAEVLVSGGKWLVVCSCANAPSASVEWDVARCFDCGAVFRHMVWPEDSTDIALTLRARPEPHTRNWRAPETLDDLKDENRERGLPDEAEE